MSEKRHEALYLQAESLLSGQSAGRGREMFRMNLFQKIRKSELAVFAAGIMAAAALTFSFSAYADTATPSNMPDTKYQIWIGNVQVCDSNREDILGDGKKAVSYDPASHRLTLSNAAISGGENAASGSGVLTGIASMEKDLSIVLKGTNRISAGTAAGAGQKSGIGILNGKGSLRLEGGGELTAEVKGNTVIGISSTGELTIGKDTKVHSFASGVKGSGVKAAGIRMNDRAVLEAMGPGTALDGKLTVSSYQEGSAYVNSSAAKSTQMWDGTNSLGTDPATGKASSFKYVLTPITDTFYYVTEGDGQVWKKGIGASASFTVHRSSQDTKVYSQLKSVEIDGKALAKTGYTVTDDSYILKIKPASLETLGFGDHQLKVLFLDGKAAQAAFSVVKYSGKSTGSSGRSSSSSGAGSTSWNGVVTSPATGSVQGNSGTVQSANTPGSVPGPLNTGNPYNAPYIVSSANPGTVSGNAGNTGNANSADSARSSSVTHQTGTSGPDSSSSVYINPNVPTQHLPDKLENTQQKNGNSSQAQSGMASAAGGNTASGGKKTETAGSTKKEDFKLSEWEQKYKDTQKNLEAMKEAALKEASEKAQEKEAETSLKKEDTSEKEQVVTFAANDSEDDKLTEDGKSSVEEPQAVTAVKKADRDLKGLAAGVAGALLLIIGGGAMWIAFRKNGY